MICTPRRLWELRRRAIEVASSSLMPRCSANSSHDGPANSISRSSKSLGNNSVYEPPIGQCSAFRMVPTHLKGRTNLCGVPVGRRSQVVCTEPGAGSFGWGPAIELPVPPQGPVPPQVELKSNLTQITRDLTVVWALDSGELGSVIDDEHSHLFRPASRDVVIDDGRRCDLDGGRKNERV